MTVEWATISGGERVTGHVIFMVTGQIFKTGTWSLAFKRDLVCGTHTSIISRV